jgi:hypothetical protein
MCLVIDTCCLGMVFDGDNKNHSGFEPVVQWMSGKGRMIYGGSKYGIELRRVKNVLGVVAELSRQRKTIHIADAMVDRIATDLKARFPEPEFDDEHIVALVIASRCRVVCTNDKVAISYLRRKDVFVGYAGVDRPSIYCGLKRHKRLCCDRYVVGVCREG